MDADWAVGDAPECPQCGCRAFPGPNAAQPALRASAGCYAAYLDLTAYNLERARVDFLHQVAVDTYTAQHPGPPAKPIGLWFALVGLHLFVDDGRTGRHVQRAHTRLARHRSEWTFVEPFGPLTGFTVVDVLRASPGDDRDEAITRWAVEVWSRWSALREVVVDLCRQHDL
jgi:hypothetical protein